MPLGLGGYEDSGTHFIDTSDLYVTDWTSVGGPEHSGNMHLADDSDIFDLGSIELDCAARRSSRLAEKVSERDIVVMLLDRRENKITNNK